MKRTTIATILMVLVCCVLWGCGKSEAVKSVEALIDGIGEVSVGSEESIKEAEEAFNALTDKEKEKVENAEQLTSKREELEACKAKAKEEEEKRKEEEKKKALAEKKEKLAPFLGNWKPLYAQIILQDYYTKTFEKEGVVTANISVDENNDSITPVDESTIKVRGIEYKLVEDNGITKLVSDSAVFVRDEEYESAFDRMFVHVILDEDNVGDYIGGPKKVGKFLDEWGDVSDTDAYVMSSRAYDNEDLVMLTYNDVMYEVFINGMSDSITYYEPYPIVSGSGNPTLNHFGRAQGEIWYVNGEFVSGIEAGDIKRINFTNQEARVITFSDGFKASFYIPAWGATDTSLIDMGF